MRPTQGGQDSSAYATAGKLASDGLRRVLTLAAEPETVAELPVLEVRDLLEEEIASIRAQQERERVAWGLRYQRRRERLTVPHICNKLHPVIFGW